MTVNGVWYVDAFANQCIVEKEDGSLAKFSITPFRNITESELTPYTDIHPRKRKGNPMPGYLYRFYGLELNPDATDAVRVRLKVSEKNAYEQYCLQNETTASDDIRRYIRSVINKE